MTLVERYLVATGRVVSSWQSLQLPAAPHSLLHAAPGGVPRERPCLPRLVPVPSVLAHQRPAPTDPEARGARILRDRERPPSPPGDVAGALGQARVPAACGAGRHRPPSPRAGGPSSGECVRLSCGFP